MARRYPRQPAKVNNAAVEAVGGAAFTAPLALSPHNHAQVPDAIGQASARSGAISNATCRRGFSLTEVIVVVAISAATLGLLMPVLAKVRLSGRAIECQSNLRQMLRAAELYAVKYRTYPTALRYENTGGVFKQIEWDWVSTLSGQLIGPGALWQFTDNPDRVMQCPQYHGNPGSPADPYTGYNYSTYIGGEQLLTSNPATAPFFDGASPAQIRRPSQTAMFGLGGRKTGTNKFMRSPVHHQHSQFKQLPMSAVYTGGQAFRYGRSTYVAYADGRVSSVEMPCEGEQGTPQLLEQYLGFPKNGFLSDDAQAYAP